MKHYAHIPAGVVLDVRRSLPRPLVKANGDVCHTPDAVEANGDLAEYGWYVFDSLPSGATDEEQEQPLVVGDVSWSGSAASATHRKTTIPRKQRRQRKLAHGKSLFAAADWTAGPAWSTYKAALRVEMAGLIDDTIAPKDVVWPTLPGDVEIP